MYVNACLEIFYYENGIEDYLKLTKVLIMKNMELNGTFEFRYVSIIKTSLKSNASAFSSWIMM